MPGAQRGACHLAARQRIGNRRQQAGLGGLAERGSQRRTGNPQAVGEPHQPLARADRWRREIGKRKGPARLDQFALRRGCGFTGGSLGHQSFLVTTGEGDGAAVLFTAGIGRAVARGGQDIHRPVTPPA